MAGLGFSIGIGIGLVMTSRMLVVSTAAFTTTGQNVVLGEGLPVTTATFATTGQTVTMSPAIPLGAGTWLEYWDGDTNVTLSGSVITAWTGRISATPFVLRNSPTLSATGMTSPNRNTAVLASASSQDMTVNSLASQFTGTNTALTVAMHLQQTTAATLQLYWYIVKSTDATMRRDLFASSAVNWTEQKGDGVTGNDAWSDHVPDTSEHTIILSDAGATQKFYRDGVVDSHTGTLNKGAITGLDVFAVCSQNGANYFNGKLRRYAVAKPGTALNQAQVTVLDTAWRGN
jgi:hypothetical protein